MAKLHSRNKESKEISPKKVKKIKKGKINKANAETKVLSRIDRRKKWNTVDVGKPKTGLDKKRNGNKVNMGQLADMGIHLKGPKPTKKSAIGKVKTLSPPGYQKKIKVKTLIKKLKNNVPISSTDDGSNKDSLSKPKKLMKATIPNKTMAKMSKLKKRTRSKRKSQRISHGLESAKAIVTDSVETIATEKKKKKKNKKKSIQSQENNDNAITPDPLKKARGRPKTASKQAKINVSVESQESNKKVKKKRKRSKRGLKTMVEANDKSTNNEESNKSVLKKRGRPKKAPKLQTNGINVEANEKIVKKKSKISQTQEDSNVSPPKKKSSSNDIALPGAKHAKKISPKKLENDEGNRRSKRAKDLTDIKSLKGVVKTKEKIANGKAKRSKRMKKAILNVLDDSQIVKKKSL